MIKINLATRKQAVGGAAESKAAGGFKLPGALSQLNWGSDQLKELPLRRLLIPIVACVAGTYLLDTFKTEEMDKVEAVSQKLRAETSQLTASVAKMKGYEALRKAIEADELALRSKIDTIQRLIADRANPPKVMRAVSAAMPKDVWLSALRAGESDLVFKGYSLDFNQISDFMKNLSESAYFSDLYIRNTMQAKTPDGLDVAEFELGARRR